MNKIIVFNLGSNLGDKKQNIISACQELTKTLNLTKTKQSTFFKSPAMLKENSPKDWNKDFYNISFFAQINLNQHPPLKILKIIKQIEQKLGRKNRGKWSPREIDIDILLIESTKMNTPQLTIPHYDLKNRPFFTQTLSEVLPNWQTLL